MQFFMHLYCCWASRFRAACELASRTGALLGVESCALEELVEVVFPLVGLLVVWAEATPAPPIETITQTEKISAWRMCFLLQLSRRGYQIFAG